METKRTISFGPIIFFGLLTFYLVLSFKLRFGFDLNDETEKLITAELLHSGLRLYKDIFVQHGPVAYLLSQLVYSFGQARDMAVQRWIPITISLLALASVFYSPLLTKRRSRWMAGSLMLLGLLFTQCIYSFVMTMYQVYCGYFFVIALSGFLLPLLFDREIRRWQATAAGFLMVMIFFCAFSFVIAISCFCLAVFVKLNGSSNSRQHRLRFVCGIVLGLLSIGAWFFAYGDIKAYFISHIYFNLFYYKQFMTFSPFGAFVQLIPGLTAYLFPWANTWYTHVLLIINYLFLVLLGVFLLRRNSTQYWTNFASFVLMFLAVTFMNPRMEVTLFASTIVIIAISTIALAFAFLDESRPVISRVLISCAQAGLVVFLITGVTAQVLMKTQAYNLSPLGYYHAKGKLASMATPEMNFLRDIVGPEEGVLQVPFNLNFYLWVDRLPAFGIYYWFPWQNKYASEAINGYPYDLCAQLKANPPKLIHYSHEHIWNIPPKTFLSCIEQVLLEAYLPLKWADKTWIRADLIEREPKLQSAVMAEPRKRRKLRSIESGQCLLMDSLQLQTVALGDCNKDSVLTWMKREGEMPNRQFTLMAIPELLCLKHSHRELEGDAFHLWPCRSYADQALQELNSPDGFRLRTPGSEQCLKAEGQKIELADCESATVWTWLN